MLRIKREVVEEIIEVSKYGGNSNIYFVTNGYAMSVGDDSMQDTTHDIIGGTYLVEWTEGFHVPIRFAGESRVSPKYFCEIKRIIVTSEVNEKELRKVLKKIMKHS